MLFCYMAIAGGLIAVGVLIYKGLLWSMLRRFWTSALNWLLFRQAGLPPAPGPKSETKGIPYGAAIALGMVVLFWRGS
jgi:Flp pilus assembly protein protease CpaA